MTKKISLVVLLIILVFISFFTYTMLAYNWTDKISLISYRFEPGTKVEIVWQDGNVEHLDFQFASAQELGLRSRPNSLIKNWVETPQGEIIFSAEYEIDDLGRRKSLNPDQAQKHAVFFGCSDLLGMGVSIENTIPSLFSQNTEGYRSYNYGYVGASPAHFLRLLETSTFHLEVEEQSGVVYYVMTEGHYPKTVGKFGHMHQPEMPIYGFEDSNLVYKGNYEELRPIITKFKRHAAGSLLNRIIDPNVWTFYSQKEKDLICSIVAQTQLEFKRNFPHSELVYFLHENMRELDRKEMISCLDKNQIAYIDAQLDYYDEEAFETSSIDRHPTGEVNYIMVKKMINKLDKND
jgi:hypothetical protein